MEATMTPLMTRPLPMSHEEPHEIKPEPEPVMESYDEQPVYYYNEPPSQPTDLFKNFDRQAMIMLFAAFFVGFLLGSLRRPVILKT